MVAVPAKHHSSPSAWVFATVLPGPRTGQTLTSLRLFEAVRAAGAEGCHYSIQSRVGAPLPLLPALIKGTTTVWAALKLRFTARRSSPRLVYYCPNARGGLWFDRAFYAAASRHDRLILHHHVASYLTTPTPLAGRVFARVPANAIHLFSCRCLADRYTAAYGPAECRILPLTFMADIPSGERKARLDRTFTVGHLSNLSAAKGLETVLAVSRQLQAEGVPHRLKLAGPFQSPADEAIWRREAANRPEVEYLGPLYGEAKWAFYRSLDAFAFPSRYTNETWGLVATEATAVGVPTVVSDITCLGTQVPAGWAVDHTTPDFVGLVAERIRAIHARWQEGDESIRTLREEFRKHFLALLQTSRKALTSLCQL